MIRQLAFAILAMSLPAGAHAAVNPPDLAPDVPSIRSHIKEELPWHPTNHPHPSPQCAGTSNLELTPKNVLEQWEWLDLTAKQFGEIKGIYDRLAQETKKLSTVINEKEKSLNELLPGKPGDEKKLRAIVMEIATLYGELRFAQIRANIETGALLSPGQMEKFKDLRLKQGTPHPQVPHLP